jgi:predicted metalloprotease with PDZ domain
MLRRVAATSDDEPRRAHSDSRLPGWFACACALLACVAAVASPRAQAHATPVGIDVDAREISHHMLHARLTLHAAPGPLTLYFPKWIPGEHRTSGPIENLTGIMMSANGHVVAWERDTIDNYTFHCIVPPGAGPLEVKLDYIVAPASHGVGMLLWNEVVLYPAGTPAAQIEFEPRVTLPDGWQSATALEPAHREGASTIYRPVDLVTLIDSPVQMGDHCRAIALSKAGGPQAELDLACDSEEGLALKPATIAAMERLVSEARALFGATHYRHYRFLAGLSDHIPGEGLEHHECTDIRDKERMLVDPELVTAKVDVFSHELVHSWNGKYRRPLGLTFTDYQRPENAELLWVYEGLTQYLGYVLDGRSGLLPPEHARMEFALTAAGLEATPGRSWKSIHDTAVETGPLRAAARGWSSWRRGQDYYGEGALIWLEADATIRRLSNGKRSLDDFCRAFHGGASGGPEVKPFLEPDVIAALNAVQPYDWKKFFDDRVNALSTPTPTRALEAAGWKLTYADSLSSYESAIVSVYEYKNLRPSLGIRLENSGLMADVIPGSPAAKAGLAPGMTLVGVNGRKYTWNVLKDAFARSKSSAAPIELLVDDGEFYRVAKLDYHGGQRYAALTRIAGQPDLLDAILAPRAAVAAGPGAH